MKTTLKNGMNKVRVVLMLCAMFMFGMVQSAYAEGVADASVTSAFQTQSENIVATLSAVAPYGIAILAIFLAWHYGKRLFKAVAK